jgi:hypothetical protein
MATQDSRIRLKRATSTGAYPLLGPSSDHTDGTWDIKDIYVGEPFLNTADNQVWVGFDSEPHCIYGHVKKTITSAEVLAMGVTPIALGLSVPSGYFPNIVGDIWMGATYGTTTYATNTSLRIRSVGGSQNYVSAVNALAFTADCRIPLTKNAVTSGKGFEDGADLEIYVPAGNPTAGDSDITIYLTYMLIPV